MKISIKQCVAIAIGGAALAGSSASGQILASFSYSSLDSSFDAGSQVLTTASGSASTGEFVRQLAPVGMAMFDQGDASFMMDLAISNVDQMAGTADGIGTITLTDLDGDTITANVAGTFTRLPIIGSVSVLFFNALMTDLTFVSDDGFFDGTVGSASVDFSSTGLETFPGALVRLEITTAGFFTSSFSGGLAEVDGQIVPTPGTASLIALSGLIVARRRR